MILCNFYVFFFFYISFTGCLFNIDLHIQIFANHQLNRQALVKRGLLGRDYRATVNTSMYTYYCIVKLYNTKKGFSYIMRRKLISPNHHLYSSASFISTSVCAFFKGSKHEYNDIIPVKQKRNSILTLPSHCLSKKV